MHIASGKYSVLVLVLLLISFSAVGFGRSVSDWLIPKPQEIIIGNGDCKIPSGRIICKELYNSLVFRNIKEIQELFQKQGNLFAFAAVKAKGEIPAIQIKIDSIAINRSQGYTLTIDSTGICLTAHDEAGLFYGTLTLKQIAEYARSSGTWPIIRINDWPDFDRRGVMLDISRDKVPTMGTLFKLVDRLASWKINEFQLYTEHTFAYVNYSQVWQNYSPMTAEEIITLDQYCKDRFIDLVPNQNSFGHMENWLKYDEFSQLAECPDSCFTTEGHVSRLSLSPVEPGSLQLMNELYKELLPNFSSKYFNIGCDETVELGIGKSAELCKKLGKGQVYLDFVKGLRDLANQNGKRVQIWADILLQHPEVVPDLPKDMIPLIWGYEANHPFEKQCSIISSSGLQFYVCPGVSSWDAITGRTKNAMGNILNAGLAGKHYNAKGFLITDWGDYGHWQPLPVSYPGYMFGAAIAWNVEGNKKLNTAFLLDQWVFQDKSGLMGQTILDLGNLYTLTGVEFFNQNILFTSLRDIRKSLAQDDNFRRLTIAGIERTDSSIISNINKLKKTTMECDDAEQVLSEMLNAASLCHHSCRVIKDKLVSGDGTLNNISEQERQFLIQDISEIIADYRNLWVKLNRIGGLEPSVDEMEKILAYYEQIKLKSTN